MTDPVISAMGRSGQVTVEGDFVIIKRKGVAAKLSHGFTKGEKRINVHSINAVQLKKPGLTVGYIQFTLGGGSESRRGVMDATKDENSVTFNKKALGDFETVRDYIEQRLSLAHGPAVAVGEPDVPTRLGSSLPFETTDC